MLCEERHRLHDNKIIECEEEITLERLCDNVLLEIFSYLSAKDLKSASLVNKRWNELIGTSTVTMKKFKFQLKNEMLQLNNFGSNRNHQNYVVHLEDTTDSSSINGNIHLEIVKSFHIQRSRFDDVIGYDVMTLLSRLAQLEELSLESVRLSSCEKSVGLFEMPKLKSLRIIGSDFAILKYIDVNELQDLQCISKCNGILENFESIACAISRFSNIKRLKLWNCMETFEYIDVHQVKCTLSSIEVYHINVNPIDDRIFAENLRQFMELQSTNLQDLSLDFSMFDVEHGHRIVNNLLQIAFNKCTNLSSLDIRNLSISRDGRFYQSLSPNHSIKKLRVHWGFDGEVIEGLLRNCPKLETLEAELCHLNSNAITGIATLCGELIHLETFKLIGNIGVDALFEKLEYLKIVKIENSFDFLTALVAKCPVIKEIRIEECSQPEEKSLALDLIACQPSIRKLYVNDKTFNRV